MSREATATPPPSLSPLFLLERAKKLDADMKSAVQCFYDNGRIQQLLADCENAKLEYNSVLHEKLGGVFQEIQRLKALIKDIEETTNNESDKTALKSQLAVFYSIFYSKEVRDLYKRILNLDSDIKNIMQIVKEKSADFNYEHQALIIAILNRSPKSEVDELWHQCEKKLHNLTDWLSEKSQRISDDFNVNIPIILLLKTDSAPPKTPSFFKKIQSSGGPCPALRIELPPSDDECCSPPEVDIEFLRKQRPPSPF